MKKTFGGWAFIIGLILAVVIALLGAEQDWPVYILLVLGLIVGLLNISDKEVGPFLISAIAFMLTFTSLFMISEAIPLVGNTLVNFFVFVNAFIAPAAAVVAIKELFAHTRN